MNKLRILKKSLLKEAVIIIIILIALAGTYYFVSTQEGLTTKEIKKSENKIRATRIRITDIEKKNSIVKSSITEYNEKNTLLQNEKLSLNNKKAQDILDILRKKHRINNLTLNASPEEDYQDKKLKRKSYKVTFSEIDMSFDAMSDLHVFSFLDEIKLLFPGYLRPIYLEVIRERKYSKDLLRNIAIGERPRVVSANVRFLWFGIPIPKDLQTPITKQNNLPRQFGGVK